MADAGLTFAPPPQGAGLQDNPVLTMGDRESLLASLHRQGLSRPEIQAEMARYGVETPMEPMSGPETTAPEPVSDQVGLLDEAAYGGRRALEGAVRSAGDIAGDWFGAEGVRDTLHDAGAAIGPSDAQEEAQARQAASPDRTLTGEIVDAVAQEAAPTLGTIGAAAAAGTMIGGLPGTIIGGAIGFGIGYLRNRDETRNKAKAAKAQELYGPEATQEQIDGVELTSDDLMKVDATTAGMAALDTLTPLKVLRRVAPGRAGALVREGVQRSVAKGAARGAASDFLTEGGTEIAQTALQEVVFDPELRQHLNEDEVKELVPWIAREYGREAAVTFATGGIIGGAAGGVSAAAEQRLTNAKRLNDVSVLSTAGQNADVDIAQFEDAARNPEKASQFATDADDIRRRTAALTSADEALTQYQSTPEDQQNPDELAILQERRDRAQSAYDRTHDEVMPRYGGLTIKQVKDRNDQVEKQARSDAVERARNVGFEIDESHDPATVAAAAEPIEQAQADYDFARRKADGVVDTPLQNKYAKQAREAKARLRAAKVNARKTLYGESPKDAEAQLDREAGIANHRRRLFGDESDPQAVIDQADQVIAQRAEVGKVKENRQKGRERIAKLYEQRDAAETESEIEELNTKIAKEQAKLSQPDPLTEAAVQAKRDAQKALGIEPSPDEVANPMAGVPQDEGAQAAEVQEEETPAVSEPAPGALAPTVGEIQQLELPLPEPDAKPAQRSEQEQLAFDFTPRKGGVTEAGTELPEDHGRYFDIGEDSVTVPLTDLRPTRARPEGIANAGTFMRRAYDGQMATRKPISVRAEADGTYTVLDGNSTFANMAQAGWANVPVRIVDDAQFAEESAPKFAKKTGTKTRVEGSTIHAHGPAERRAMVEARAKKEGLTVRFHPSDQVPADDPRRKGYSLDKQHPWKDMLDTVGPDGTVEDVEAWMQENTPKNEHMAAFGPDGRILGFGTNGDPNGVTAPALAMTTEDVTFTHNHPFDTPFSGADVATMAGPRRIAAVRAVTPSGAFEMRPTPQLTEMKYNPAVMLVDTYQGQVDALYTKTADRLSDARVRQEAVLQIMEADGFIEYTQPFTGLSTAEEALVNGIVNQVLGRGSTTSVPGPRDDVGPGTAETGPDRPAGEAGTRMAAGRDYVSPAGLSADQTVDPAAYDTLKEGWKTASIATFPDVDTVLDAAVANDAALDTLGQRVSAETGLLFKKGRIKERDSIERKLADKGVPAGALGDVVRGGFVVNTADDAQRVVEAIARHRGGIDVAAEDWRVTPAGYADRSLLIRFPDGQLGEIQLWEPHLYLAKEGRDPRTMEKVQNLPFETGHSHYEIERDKSRPAGERAASKAYMRELYGAAVSHADPSIQALVFGKAPSIRPAEGNRFIQSFSDMGDVEGRASSSGLPAYQRPPTNVNTSSPTATTASPSDVKNSTGVSPYARIARGISEQLTRYNVPEEVRQVVNPVLTNTVPAASVGNNEQAAHYLQARFAETGKEPVLDFTRELTPAEMDVVSSIMAAETAAGLERVGNAADWYTGSMERMYEVVGKHWPVLVDDAAAAELGLGNANNARFVFTYTMATTSQNLDVMANAKATRAAFDAFLKGAAKGRYKLDPKYATGDKQVAMADNFRKFGLLMDAIEGDVPTKLNAMDRLFREKRTVKEWVALMKAEGLPYSAPGQTAMDAVVYGSSTLGPKIGNGFWQNLNGNYEPVTIDLWMRRTWGRMTGKSIGNESAFPEQYARLKTASQRSFQTAGRADVLAEYERERTTLQAELAAIQKDDSYPTKKAKTEAANEVKRQIRALDEAIPDVANLRVPEPWPGLEQSDLPGVLEYSRNLKRVWDKEYKRLAAEYKAKKLGKVPDHVQPTWARAAKMIVANQGAPLDQVANGTQRKQIEQAVAQARQKLAAQGIDISAADMQAVLWYPEKDLWNALTDNLEVDSQGHSVVSASPLNESYDTAFEKIFAGDTDGQQDQAGDGSGRDQPGTQPIISDGADPDATPDGLSGQAGDGVGGEGPRASRGVDVALGRATYPGSWLQQELGVNEITPEQAQRLVDEAARITGVEAGPLTPARGGWFNPNRDGEGQGGVETEPSSLIRLETKDPNAGKQFAAVLGHMAGQHSVMVLGEEATPSAHAFEVVSTTDPEALFEAARRVDPDMFGGFSATDDGIILMVPTADTKGQTPEQIVERLAKEMDDAGYEAEFHGKSVGHSFVGAETDPSGQKYDLSLRDAGTEQQTARRYLGDANRFARDVLGAERQGPQTELTPGQPEPIYVSRDVLDDGGIRSFYEQAGLTGLLDPADMHVTVTYSKAPVDIANAPAKATGKSVTVAGPAKQLDNALVVPLTKGSLTLDHKRYRKAGASHDYGDNYQPHITIKYDPSPEEVALAASAGKPSATVKLGPEVQKKLRVGWRPDPDEGGPRVSRGVAIMNRAKESIETPHYLDLGTRDARTTMTKVIDAAKHPTKTTRSFLEATEDAVFNQFAPIRRLEIAVRGKLAQGAESAFKSVEMAVNDSGRAEALMYYGAGELGQHGEYRVKNGTMGLRPIFDLAVSKSKNKGQGIVDWMAYMAARRAQTLHDRGIKTPLTETDIADALAKETPEFKRAAEEWKKHNDANIDFLVDTGRITAQQAEAMKDDDFYVPFYRSDEKMADGTSPDFDLSDWLGRRGGNMTAGGAVMRRDPGIKKIVGGDKKAIDNLLQNMMRNSQAMVAAGMRNQAANRVFDLMEEAGLARTVKAQKISKKTGNVVRVAAPKNSVRMWIGGKEKHVIVDEEAAPLVSAMAGLQPAQLNGISGVMADVASIFRQGITLSPAFMIRNLVRGAVSTGIMTSGANLTAGSNTFTGMYDALRKGDATKAFTHLSGMGDYRFGGSDVGFGKNDLLIEYGMAPKTLGYRLRQAIDKAEAVGTATELADRIAAFETMKKNGFREDEAAYQALTIMNYSRRGNAAIVRTMMPMIPFLNARIQGLSRLAEGAVGKRGAAGRKQALMQLALNGAVLSAASLAFWAWNNSDEEKREKYLAEPLFRRLNYHVLYAGDTTIYIPKAFEIGHLFSSIPEMAMDGVLNDMGDQFLPGMAQIMLQTFGFNAIPAAMLPIVETTANYNFFTQEPIEGMRATGLRPADRTEGASALSVLLGKKAGLTELTGLSPAKIEHILQGYGGAYFHMLSGAVDIVGSDMGLVPPRVAGTFGDVPVISGAMERAMGAIAKPTALATTKYLGDYYGTKDHLDQIYQSAKAAATNGDVAYAQQLLARYPGALQARKIINATAQPMSDLNAAIRLTRQDPSLSPHQKAEKLKPMITARNNLARKVTEAVGQIEEAQGSELLKAG